MLGRIKNVLRNKNFYFLQKKKTKQIENCGANKPQWFNPRKNEKCTLDIVLGRMKIVDENQFECFTEPMRYSMICKEGRCVRPVWLPKTTSTNNNKINFFFFVS